MKTLADLKRALTIGVEVKMTTCLYAHKHLNINRFVVKVKGNGVEFALSKDEKQGSFFDFPKASLLDFEGTVFTVYNTGSGPLTAEEQSILDNAPSKGPENQKQLEIDMMTDGSQMFYADERYFKEKDAEYLRGHNYVRGMRYDWNDKIVKDDNIRGEALYSYEIVVPF